MDNYTTNSGSGGDTFRSQDVSGVHYAVGLVGWGPDGGPYVEVDDASGQGLPVQPDAGAVWAVSQSGAWTVTVGTHAVTQSGTWNVTNISGTVSLPTGAATAAKQPALGTAGSASADVITVQGVPGMVAVKVDGSAVIQPVSGTVTANAGTGPWPVTDNSGSLTVDAPVGAPAFVRLSDGSAAISTLPVSVAASVTVVQGTATNLKAQAEQYVGGAAVSNANPVPVSDAGGLLTVDGTVAATQSGTWDVGTVTTITNVVHVDDNSSTLSVDDGGGSLTVDGTVAVTNASLTTLAGAVYAEDAASANADPGIQVLAVQKATPADTAGTDGDYQPLQMAGGRLWVDASGKTLTVASHAVTNAGTFAVQESGSALASLQLIDDVVYAEDAASANGDKGVQVFAVQKATPADTAGTDGDYQPLQMAAGRLWVDASGKTLTVGSHDVTNAGTFAVQATQSGTWNVGTVTTVTTVSAVTNVATIGTSVTPGTGAAHLGKAEDAAHADGDTGVMALAVRKNAAASTSGSDGDYQPLITNTTGHLWVDASGQTITVASHAVTNAGTFAVQAACTLASSSVSSGAFASGSIASGAIAAGAIAAGATSIAENEDAASADGDRGVKVLAVRKGTPANTSGTDGDYEFLQLSAGRLWCSATVDAALPAGANAIGKLASNSGVTIGAVEIAASQTLATVTTVSTVTTCSTLTGGGVAHDGVDSGNPHKIGGRATTAVHSETMTANADRIDFLGGADGVQLVRPNANLESLVNGNASNTDGTSTQVIAAAGSGVKVYLTDVTITNTSASNIYVEMKDGSTVKWTFPLPANGGVTHHFGSPVGGTANTAWNFDPSAAASTVYCSASGFKSKL